MLREVLREANKRGSEKQYRKEEEAALELLGNTN